MSGGSYNYLCHKDAAELLTCQDTIQEMADRLAGLGYAQDAAIETQNLLLDIRAFQNRICAASRRLEGVWRAIEWWDSGDSGEDGLQVALKEYREPQT